MPNGHGLFVLTRESWPPRNMNLEDIRIESL